MRQRTDLNGRRMIRIDETEINDSNIIPVLQECMNQHQRNRYDIEYLYNYYKGVQPILSRKKDIRPEILNKVIINTANMIVTFKNGYLFGEPIQYVGRDSDDDCSDKISELNDYMYIEDKATKDLELGEWYHIAGIAHRMVLPRKVEDVDDSPIEIITLDPRDSLVAHANDIASTEVLGIKYTTDSNGVHTYSCYTKNHYWLIRQDEILVSEDHYLGMLPIIEYPAGMERMGCFEAVILLLDALNDLASNRVDDVDQFVQSFMKFINCDITENDFVALKEMGAIKIKSVEGQTADVEIMTSELNQTQTQALVDYFERKILELCGIPNRGNGNSSSDNGVAVQLRDGFSDCEQRAKNSEMFVTQSEKKFLKLVLRILRDKTDCDLMLRDVDIKFTRRNYEAILSKSQVLTTMLAQPKIHPLLAFEHCGMFSDPEGAYAISMDYYNENLEKWTPIDINEVDEDINDEADVQQS